MTSPEPKHEKSLNATRSMESMKYYVEQNPKAKENVLICAKFQNALYLEFGHVPVKSTNFLSFQMRNPNTTKPVNISIENATLKNGLSIAFGVRDETEVDIGPGENHTGTIYWTPCTDMSIREIVKLKMDKKAPLQLTIHGVAGTGKVNCIYNNEIRTHLQYSLLFISLLFCKRLLAIQCWVSLAKVAFQSRGASIYSARCLRRVAATPCPSRSARTASRKH